MSETNHSEIQALIDVSARLGRDPLLVQAGSGNTSVKIDGVLWIKASGKWLAHAAPRDRVIGLRLEVALQTDREGSLGGLGIEM